jgi:predicted RNA-binding protein (virulence factor B family)
MTFQAGEFARLKVSREASPYGYFLHADDREVLLPYSEAEGKRAEGDELEVFLYHDTEDRLSATMKRPLLSLGEVGLLEVVDLHPRFGAFLEMGLGRNLLLPYREQPELEELRPIPGDKVYVKMDHDKQGRLLARLAGEEELMPLVFKAPGSWMNRQLEARVYRPLQMGTFVICEGGVLGFGAIGMIHASERTRLLRLGEKVDARVAFVREDGRVNLSMKQPKEAGRNEDSDAILAYLRERPNGAMPFSDSTPADVIADKFNISKSAFKRALGKLMKERLVYQKENWTYLSQTGELSQTEDKTE